MEIERLKKIISEVWFWLTVNDNENFTKLALGTAVSLAVVFFVVTITAPLWLHKETTTITLDKSLWQCVQSQSSFTTNPAGRSDEDCTVWKKR